MDPVRFEQLLERFLSGEATREESAELENLLRTHPEHRRSFFERHLLEANLRDIHSAKLSQQESPDVSARRVKGSVDKPSTRRSPNRLSRNRPAPSLVPFLIAAGVLPGLVILFLSGSESPTDRKPTREVSRQQVKRTAEPGVEAQRGPSEGQLRAEADRKQAEEKLAALRQQEEVATKERENAKEAELRRKANEELAKLKAEREEAEARLARAKEAEQQALEAASKAAVEPSQEKARTQAALTKLGRVEGQVYLLTKEERRAAKEGDELLPDQGIATVGAKSLVAMIYPDKTKVDVGSETEIRDLKIAGGKRLFIAYGSLRAVVAKQLQGQSMVIETPHGEVRVLGTTLRIAVDRDPNKGTRVEVDEGRVQLIRKPGGKTAEVPSGFYAIAALGVELIARPHPIRDILLKAQQGVLSGGEWAPVKDPQAVQGSALEVLKTVTADRSSLVGTPCVTFTFKADANVDYAVWIRGNSVATQDRRLHDSILIEVQNGRFVRGRVNDNPLVASIPERALFDGYMHGPGYLWLSGDNDPGLDVRAPVTVHFARSGPQTLRLYGYEPPMRVDAIWMSTTQTTRPEDTSTGPGSLRK